jgi:hypothetical protein
VPRSPFVVTAEQAKFDVNKVRVNGETLTGTSNPTVGRVHVLELDASEAGLAVPEVQLFAPSGKQLPVKIKTRYSDGKGEEVSRITIEEELEESEEVQIERYVYTRSLSREQEKRKTSGADAATKKPKIGANSRKDSLESVPTKDVRPMAKYWIEYVCEEEGEHRMEVKYGGASVPCSPFQLRVQRALDVTKVRTEGAGVGGQVRIGQPVTFVVDQRAAGQGQLTVNVLDSEGKRVQVQSVAVETDRGKSSDKVSQTVKSKGKSTSTSSTVTEVTECTYTTRTEGKHEVQVMLDGQHVIGSPFEVDAQSGACKAKVFGAGLKQTVQNARTTFAVCNNGEQGAVEVELIAPNRQKVPIQLRPDSNQPDLTLVEYECSEVGEYELIVRVGGKPVSDSPFKVKVHPINGDFEPSKARLVLEPPADACVGRPARLSIDLQPTGSDADRKSTTARLHVLRLDELCERVCEPCSRPSGVEGAADVRSTGSRKRAGSLVEFEYVPAKQGRHLLWVECDDVGAAGRPIQMQVRSAASPDQVRLSGPAVQNTSWTLGEKQTIELTLTNNEGRCEVFVVDLRSGRAVPVRVRQTETNKYEAQFRPSSEGRHQLLVTLDGQPLAGLPATYTVQAPFDTKQVTVQHLHTSKWYLC